MSITYVIFLTDSLGVGDVAAGGSYGMWGTLTVAWGIIIGPVIDHLGAFVAAPPVPFSYNHQHIAIK